MVSEHYMFFVSQKAHQSLQESGQCPWMKLVSLNLVSATSEWTKLGPAFFSSIGLSFLADWWWSPNYRTNFSEKKTLQTESVDPLWLGLRLLSLLLIILDYGNCVWVHQWNCFLTNLWVDIVCWRRFEAYLGNYFQRAIEFGYCQFLFYCVIRLMFVCLGILKHFQI